jgi:hypothetical protein
MEAQTFFMEKDSKRFPKSGGWGYALFNYEAASDKFTADAKSPSDCGNACRTVVKAKDTSSTRTRSAEPRRGPPENQVPRGTLPVFTAAVPWSE